MAKRFRISASGLNAYFHCPASYEYGKTYSLIGVSTAIQNGLDAHAIMSGKEVKEPSELALKFVEKLKAAEKQYQMVPIVRERKFVTPIGESVELVRIIDMIAASNGSNLIVDYKTTSSINSWRDAKGVMPKALGFQTAAYLYPEPAGPQNPMKKWPTTMVFMVADPYSPDVKMFGHEVQKEDLDNLKAAIKIVQTTKKFPKFRTDACFDCDFFAVCYDRKGWEDKYKKRGDNGNTKK